MLQNNNLKTLYNKITSLESYKPSKNVNTLFSKLVKVALTEGSSSSLTANELTNLQRICSLSEFELEKHWAEKLITNKKPLDEIESFPYINNYRKLTKMEWYSLLSCSKHEDHNILFVGGGPLPLTAIILASEYDNKVTILEKDDEAANISMQLITKLKLSDKINVIKIDASKFDGYKNFNVIMVAALAGINKNVKKKILSKIKSQSKNGIHVLARSSWGMREILYRPIDSDIFKLFKTEIEVRPHNDIVNSVIIFTI